MGLIDDEICVPEKGEPDLDDEICPELPIVGLRD